MSTAAGRAANGTIDLGRKKKEKEKTLLLNKPCIEHLEGWRRYITIIIFEQVNLFWRHGSHIHFAPVANEDFLLLGKREHYKKNPGYFKQNRKLRAKSKNKLICSCMNINLTLVQSCITTDSMLGWFSRDMLELIAWTKRVRVQEVDNRICSTYQ